MALRNARPIFQKRSGLGTGGFSTPHWNGTILQGQSGWCGSSSDSGEKQPWSRSLPWK